MISRKGTRTSDASSGVTKILRDEGSGPVVTAGFSSAELTGLFMMLLPSGVFNLFSAKISKQAKHQSEYDPDRGGDRWKLRSPQHGVSGLYQIARREQPQRAADKVEPPEQRDQYAPVGGPEIVTQHDREPGRHDQQTAEKHQRAARQKLLRHVAEPTRIGEHGDADCQHHRPDQPCDEYGA